MTIPRVRVAVGLLQNQLGQYLVAIRPEGTSMAGYCEFPGGKVNEHESTLEALERELHEEVDIHMVEARPYHRFQYLRGGVCIDVHSFRVLSWEGMPRGKEGQALRYVAPMLLPYANMIPENALLLKKLRLPVYYAIINAECSPIESIQQKLAMVAHRMDILVQLRFPSFSRSAVLHALMALHPLPLSCVVNATIEADDAMDCGLHLNSFRLASAQRRPLSRTQICGASCHNVCELKKAHELDMDYALLSPVKCPTSHQSERDIIGWRQFGAWAQESRIPVYALGGMGPEDLAQAQQHSAHGVAMVSAFNRIFD